MAIIWNEKPIGAKPQPSFKLIETTKTLNLSPLGRTALTTLAVMPGVKEREPILRAVAVPGAVERVVGRLGPAPGVGIKVPFMQKEVRMAPLAPTVTETVKWATEVPEKIITSLKEIPYTIQNKTVPEYTGKVYRVPSYQEDAINMRNSLLDLGYSPTEAVTAAVLQTGGQAIIDVSIVASLIESGARAISKNISPNLEERVAAWKTMGRPSTKGDLTKEQIRLSRMFSPELYEARVAGTANVEALKAVNSATAILREGGIPTQADLVKIRLKPLVEALAAPETQIFTRTATGQVKLTSITDIIKPSAELQTTLQKGLRREVMPKVLPGLKQLPGYVPITERPAIPVGATIEPMKPVGKGIIPQELLPREKSVLDLRKQKMTYEEVGKQLGVTAERVRQIEAKILEKTGLTPSELYKEVKEVKPEITKPIITPKEEPSKVISADSQLPVAPDSPYKRELLEEIGKLPALPKIEKDVLTWKPPTLNYQNPFTQRMYRVWDKLTERMPTILRTFRTKEIQRITLEKQRIIDGLTKKYTEEIVRPLEKLSREERSKIGQMIFKYIPVESGYKTLIKNIDSHIGQLGKAIVDLDKKLVAEKLLKPDMSLLSEETWFRHLGEYMRTLYLRPSKVVEGKFNIIPRKVFSADGIIDRSAFKRKMTDMEWGLNSLQFEGRSLDEITTIFNETPKAIEDIGKEAKKAWGWRTEADLVLARTFKDMVNNYATRLWQESIVRTSELFSKTFKKDFIPIKNMLPRGITKDIRLGPLNDGYINPILEDDIRTMVTYGRDTIERIMGEPLSWWKAFKVAGNPATVMRNYLSGAFIQTDMAGYPVWSPRNTKYYVESVKDYLTKSPFYKKLRDGGMYGSDYYAVEIEQALLKEIEKVGNPAETLAKRLLDKLGEGIKDTKQLFSYYGHIDHLQRTYLAKVAMRDGAMLPQAIHFANKWELDYRFVPPIIDKMRGPIGGWIAPFISFYSLMAPRILETVATRPWVLLKYPIAIAALGYISEKILGYTHEQAETAKPSFLQNDPYTILTPFTDENGNPIYINLTYTLPFGGWQTAFIDIPAIGNMIQSMGFAGGIQAVMNNYDPFTQRKIFEDGDLPEVKREKIANYILRFVSPGAVSHILNIWDASQGKVTGWPYPREKDLTQAIARSLGISTYTGGYNEAIAKIRAYDQEIKDIQIALANILRNVNISPDEKQKKMLEARQEIEERIKKIQDIGKSMPPAPKLKEGE